MITITATVIAIYNEPYTLRDPMISVYNDNNNYTSLLRLSIYIWYTLIESVEQEGEEDRNLSCYSNHGAKT